MGTLCPFKHTFAQIPTFEVVLLDQLSGFENAPTGQRLFSTGDLGWLVSVALAFLR